MTDTGASRPSACGSIDRRHRPAPRRSHPSRHARESHRQPDCQVWASTARRPDRDDRAVRAIAAYCLGVAAARRPMRRRAGVARRAHDDNRRAEGPRREFDRSQRSVDPSADPDSRRLSSDAPSVPAPRAPAGRPAGRASRPHQDRATRVPGRGPPEAHTPRMPQRARPLIDTGAASKRTPGSERFSFRLPRCQG